MDISMQPDSSDYRPRQRTPDSLRVQRARQRWLLLGVAAWSLAGCERESVVTTLSDAPRHPPAISSASTQDAQGTEDLNPRLLRRFKPLTIEASSNVSLVHLGRMLYFEPLLSRTGKVSCNSRHPLTSYGTTATAVAVGIDGRRGARNAPSTFNAAGHFRQFWDGRAANLEEQAAGPIENPAVMGMTAEQVLKALRGVEGYRAAFAKAYPADKAALSFNHVTGAIATFERGLITPGRWDRYLLGDHSALSSREKDGAKLFANLGCMVCHTGAYVGGSMFEKLGVQIPWPNQHDRGRAQVSQNAADAMVFKVPSLRNVAQTAPYFHDGSVAKLEAAVRLMAYHQLGVTLDSSEIQDIVAWLGALTGDIPREYIRRPNLPAAVRP